MKRSWRILVGLIMGLVAGLLISVADSPALHKLASLIEPVGAVWVNLLKMTVLPLVVSLLVTSFASASDSGRAGRIAGTALLVFLTLYVAGAALAALAAPPLLSWLNVNPSMAASLKASAPAAAPEGSVATPPLGEQIANLIPENPFRAASDGAVLPLVVFSLLFGLALTRVEPEGRSAVARFFRGVADTMLVIVRWLLVVAPVGVFAVVLPLAARVGFSLVGALAYYVGGVVVLVGGFTLALYPLVMRLGRVPLGRFARACTPAQSVALSTQSSLASLPAMVEGAEARLGVSPQTAGAVLPMAVSVFRFSGVVQMPVAAVFAAKLYGVEIGLGWLATLAAVSVLVAVAGVGLPGGASFFAPHTTTFLALGLPAEMIPLLFAVDTIPDMAQTVSNVTADMAAVALTKRMIGSAAGDPVAHPHPADVVQEFPETMSGPNTR